MSAMSDLHADVSRAAGVRELHHLAQDSRELVERLRVICGDDDQAFLDTLDGEMDVTEAASRALRWLHEQQAQAEACKSLSDIYAARRKVFDGRVEGARTALFHFLQYLGVKSMPLPEGTLSIVAGREKVMGDPDADALPDTLVRIKREPDKTAIKAALEAGETVAGYTLSNGGQTLQVKVG